jgi:hypothetical protein
MKRARRSLPDWLWVTLPIIGVVVVFIGCVLHEPLWGALGVFHLKPYFADSVVILAANDAKVAGIDPYLPGTGFDYLGRPHVYGPLWLELHRFGLTRVDFIWFGGTVGVVAVIAAAFWCRPRGLWASLACLSLLASPGFLLGYERANNDLIVLALLLAAALAMQFPSWLRMTLAAMILVLVSLLKFYPLVALLMLAIRSQRWRALLCGVGAVLVLGLLCWMQREEFTRAISNVPREVTALGYGAKVVGVLWSHPYMPRGFFSCGGGIGLVFWAWFAWRENRDPIPLGNRAAGFVAGVLAWGFCFFTNGNYSYRALLLILPAGAWLIAVNDGKPSERVNAWLAIIGLAVTLWLALPHDWMNRLASVTELRVAGFLLGLENGMVWGLTLYLLWAAAREGLASWRGSSWSKGEKLK